MGEKQKKIIKTIKIDVDLCNGCRACEVVCSAFHATPKYSSNNPARSRIRVIRLTERNTTSVPSAGLPAHPGIFSKNPIPVSL
jgi:Fe-S-cluster-containing dehydrogenase component